MNVPDRSMFDVAEVSVKPCGGDTACEVLPPLGRNGGRLWDVQGLQAGRRHWLGSMAAVLLGAVRLRCALTSCGRLRAQPQNARRYPGRRRHCLSQCREQSLVAWPWCRWGLRGEHPRPIWNGIPVLVTGSSSGWFAVLGIPLHTLQDRLVLEDAGYGTRRHMGWNSGLNARQGQSSRR